MQQVVKTAFKNDAGGIWTMQDPTHVYMENNEQSIYTLEHIRNCWKKDEANN